MKITVTSREKAAQVIAGISGSFAVISVSDPYDDPARHGLDLRGCGNRCKGWLRLEVFDTSRDRYDSDRLVFNAHHKEAAGGFLRYLLWCRVKNLVIHCDRGVSRSPGLALGIKRLFGEDIEEIVFTEETRPNEYIRDFFNTEGKDSLS